MRKRTCFYLYVCSLYVSTAALIVLAAAAGPLRSVWGNWSYCLLAVATIIWFRLIKRQFRTRPKGRPGVWTQEMEVARHRTVKPWDE